MCVWGGRGEGCVWGEGGRCGGVVAGGWHEPGWKRAEFKYKLFRLNSV